MTRRAHVAPSRVGDNIADIAIEGGHLISGTGLTRAAQHIRDKAVAGFEPLPISPRRS